ncbi:uncharacterized protein F54H12.2-like [Ruditapes philippinarum]|uniref:uncharacterized protein F54H12.2-like n=1 Tax=Ruditapes philippinarum TaxID=129788 RepID=UPI00295C0C6B|nr:uncharacterized protein F54H12.2-like [Ruditapes philippinarum]
MDVELYHQEELSLFTSPISDQSLQSREWIQYKPVGQVNSGSAIEFNIPAQSSAYIDLKRSVLRVKLAIVDGDGTDLDENVITTLINLPFHTIFGQVDVSLQQTTLSHNGANYPYKAYIDTILRTNKQIQDNLLGCQMFYKDTGDVSTSDAKTGSNEGLKTRYSKTKGSSIVDLEGPLHIELFRQSKLLINGVSIGLKLHHARDAFRIITDSMAPSYKVKITDASFNLCIQRLNGAFYLAQEKLIQDMPAIYPYLRSELKSSAIASGQYSFSADDVFQGLIPSKLIVGLVSSNSFNGDYSKNPFDFKHFNCNFIGFYIDGQSIPSQPLQPNYSANQYVDCYRGLGLYRNDIDVTLEDYKNGYCLYVLDIDPYHSFNTKRRGHCRLELKFAVALPESVTLIMYASFPETLNIDKSRAVFLK